MTWILFLDFAKAYDMVNQELLFEKMNKLDIQEDVIQGVKLMFNNLSVPTKHGNIPIGRGLG